MTQRDWAMAELSKLQHPDIVTALAKISRSPDDTLRVLAVIYLGEQTAFPGIAGEHVLSALKRNPEDIVLVLSALQSLGSLKYLGAVPEIKKLLGYEDFAVKKGAILAVGDIGEMRLWKEVCKLAGVEVKIGDDVDGRGRGVGKEEVVSEGYSYDGVEVTYDTGTAGDGDQREAERIGQERLAANKAAAMAKAGGRGGAGGGGVAGGATGRGGAARNPKELLPAVLTTLFKLTGEKFSSPKDVAKWVVGNRAVILAKVKELNAQQKAQEAEAAAWK